MTFEELYAAHFSLCRAKSTLAAPHVQRCLRTPWVTELAGAVLVLETELSILKRVITDHEPYEDWLQWSETKGFKLDTMHSGWFSLLEEDYMLTEQIHRARLKLVGPFKPALVPCLSSTGTTSYYQSSQLFFDPIKGYLKVDVKDAHILLPPGYSDMAGETPFTPVEGIYCWKVIY
ncbi:putative isomerase protein [Ranid herpesvirus 3]|uniref:Putative isomerase protein n=1 Tax=Ranid herpesvirus 3 TaxID=1987509 RepID=A0A1X9T5A7_9VIRU|nr:putative isomerase protein [Ranid herpesvirus 3]ARR28883.1 putative isomerase protein [Ranid herpesvirus 3]